MKSTSIFEIKPRKGAVFIDNLTLCSADRLLNSAYHNISLPEDNRMPLIKLFVQHDLLNLNLLIEGLLLHEHIYINAEFVNRWNKDIDNSSLRNILELVTPITCPPELRKEIENKLRDYVTDIPQNSFLNTLSESVYWNTHHAPSLDSLERQYIQPYDEGHPFGTPYYIGIATSFYLACSQLLGVPYKPSIIRSQILGEVLEKDFTSKNYNAAEISIKLLEKSREEVADEYLSKLLELNIIETKIPLILSFILKEANNPNDIIPITMQIRNSKNAKAFRSWCNNFSEEIMNGNLKNIFNHYKDLDKITKDMHKYMGIEKEESISLKLGWGPIEHKKTFSLPEIINKPIYFKRHLLFLGNLYKNIMSVSKIYPLLNKVFHKELRGLNLESNIGLEYSFKKYLEE